MKNYKELLKELKTGQHDIFNQPETCKYILKTPKGIEYALTRNTEEISIIYIDRRKRLRLTNTLKFN